MHRELGGASFAELGLPEGLGRDEELEALHDSIDWAPFARLLRSVHDSREGRKAYPPLTMFKVCILQQWYGGASDPAIERALRRDLAFRRFVGLGLNDGQPDHSTIHRFRAQLERGGLAKRLFAELRRQQEAAGLLLREGALLGAGGVIGIPARFGIAAALQAWSEYNANESCGKCTPCREGSGRMSEALARLAAGDEEARRDIDALIPLISQASLCGLRQMAPNPVTSARYQFGANIA